MSEQIDVIFGVNQGVSLGGIERLVVILVICLIALIIHIQRKTK